MFSVYSALCLSVALSLCMPQSSCFSEDTAPGITASGDIIIGGMFPIHSNVDKSNICHLTHANCPCVRLNPRGLATALVMISAIEFMNRSPPLADVNITLGYWIHDTCSDVSTALRAAADFNRHTQSNFSTFSSPVVAVIGASYSEMSIAVARQLTLTAMPQISYSSSAVILSDKNRFPTFMRTIPNDKHQTAAMVELLNMHKWNWVGIITNDGDYGRSALDYFVAQASERGICVAFRCILPASPDHQDMQSAIKQAAKTIFRSPKVQAIVSFSAPFHMKHLYQQLQKVKQREGEGSMRRVWVASDSWSSSSSVLGNFTLHDIGHVVGFTFKSEPLSSLFEYLKGLQELGLKATDKNPFLQEFYGQLNKSHHFKPPELVSKAVEIIRNNSAPDMTLSIEMAVSALAHAVASICRNRDCNSAATLQPWQVLSALKKQKFQLWGKSYSFDSSGDINLGYDVTMWQSSQGTVHVHNVVAEYDTSSKSFVHINQTHPKLLQNLKHIISRCSNSCVPGEFKKTAEGQHTCCYECINCTENHYSNRTDMDQCLACQKTEWSEEGSSSCSPKTLLFFSWRDVFAIVLLTFSAVGLLLVLLVSVLFLRHRATPVVKASVGPLSQVILYALVVSFISTTLFVGRPNNLQCKVRHLLFGISFTLCVSCILVKTLKILLAFQFNPALQQLLHRLYKPYVIISVCVGIQMVVCITWVTLKGPTKDTVMGPETILEHCNEGSHWGFGFMLGYIALLALVCFVCAFKGRKLPQQYNEAKFITFSMLLYLISWILFIPVYIKTDSQYRPAVEMVVILISNYGVVACHFLPKCYIIIFRKEQNTTNAFRKNLYAYACKPTKAESVSNSSASEQQTCSQLSSVTSVAVSCTAVRPTITASLKHASFPEARCRSISI
ncbi:G-protein coupled receptor family C group 6 member A [Synchiropus splendidus]|uniref:G-protein coupled receptor family C group 6 member A n=1 Tax=Synchiropus splendidus TaxID=270530 RepID=UPI00237E864C|nr:G-protein coupled receptor family C group 6 member A [Synchiropus splendidus]